MTDDFLFAEGIILRVVPFREYDQILTVFTSQKGVIKVFHRGNKKEKQRCAPLTGIEIMYQDKGREIFICTEMKIIESYLFLRQAWLFLQVASDLLQVILHTQLVGHPVPELYTLFRVYLTKIPLTPNPWILSVSLRLKLLKYEGWITVPFICAQCQEPLLTTIYLDPHEWCCKQHKKVNAICLEEDQLYLLYHLVECQKYSEIASHEISTEIFNHINQIFIFTINQK